MPHFRIKSNVPTSKIPEDFVTRAVPMLAKAFVKDERECVVSVIPELRKSFAGSTEPCTVASLMSIGGLGIEHNKKHAKVLFDLVEEELGVSSDRMDITFQDEPTCNIAFGGLRRSMLFLDT